MKKLIAGLILIPTLAFSFLTPSNHESEQFANPGLVAYAASYSDDASDEPRYANQYSKTFQYLNLGETLNNYRGDSVKVGILDSGINYDHEDFMVNNQTKVQSNSKYYSYNYTQSKWEYYSPAIHGYSCIDDTHGHGTNVAATVAAAINGIGGTGLAPNVELYVYKVTSVNSEGKTVYEFGAVQNALTDAKTLGIDVINMSFQSYEHAVSYGSESMNASSGCSSILTTWLNTAHNAGITLVGAAGNFNTDERSYPGSNDYVINVGSLSSDGTTKAPFSNYGSTIDLVAPGYVNVAGISSNSHYKDTSGTSFSAPLVTAAIALYKQQNPSATPNQIEQALYNSCDPIDDTYSEYNNWAGHGSLNVARFLGLEDAPTVDSVSISPSVKTLDLNGTKTVQLSATVNGDNNPSQEVTWSTSDSGLATVSSSGYVTAKAEGEVTITATSVLDDTKSGTCTITIKDSSKTPVYTIGWGNASGTAGTYTNFNSASSGSVANLLSYTTAQNSAQNAPFISNTNMLRLYYASSTYGCSITLTPASNIVFKKLIIYSNATSVTARYSIDRGSDVSITKTSSNYVIDNISVKSSIEIQNANSSNEKIDISKIEITYETISLTSISIETHPTKTTYDAGEYFNPSGLVIRRYYSDESSSLYTYANHTSEFTFSPALNTALKVSDTSVTITYGGKSTSQSITVNKVKELSSITISGYTTLYVEGDSFNFGGTVTAHYDDSTSENVTSSAIFAGYTMTTVSQQTVTVSYTYRGTTKTTQYNITVNAGTVDHLVLSGQTTVYSKNASFSFDGTCTAVFVNGYEKVVTPTNVTSPDMTSAGQKEVTVSFTYNSKTVTKSYNITVNAYRTVIENVESSIYCTYNFSSFSGTDEITTTSTIQNCYSSSGGITGVTTANKSGKIYKDTKAIRMGTSSASGSLTFDFGTTYITNVSLVAKGWSSSESNCQVNITNGGYITTIDEKTFETFNVALSSATNSITISVSSDNRARIQSITFYRTTSTPQDIGQSEDCVGLETFINNNMHMDYTENLGYCKDSTHHYYSTARDAFNVLNDHQRTLFTTNAAYTNEWDRLRTWAEFNGESLNNQNKLGAIEKIFESNQSSNEMIVLVVIVSMISLSVIGGYFYFKNKREISK